MPIDANRSSVMWIAGLANEIQPFPDRELRPVLASVVILEAGEETFDQQDGDGHEPILGSCRLAA
jgi:hypothetical protein